MMANHLSGESSPYLLQHAGNPVDWYPWGPEALDKARAQDKPIFLSIGYSACHWCHVMERESFEDEDTAGFLNEHFVSIKVDREERPDLDAVYMEAVQALNGQGGWPLSVWLTPEGKPFFGGTYFPPVSGRGMPSFRQVLEAIIGAWSTRRADLESTADSVREHLRRGEDTVRESGGAAGGPGGGPGGGPVSVRPQDVFDRGRILAEAAEELHASVDRNHGGWGGAPKFPQPLVLEYLLALQTVSPRPELEEDLTITLDAMAAGGMYDHLGGGFHRYSTDGYWLVPHFEKMLYDNAQLARCYLHAWQSLRGPHYLTVATETLDYLLREMRHPQGGFFSAQDADTAAGEGAYFSWTLDEVRAALTAEEADAVQVGYGLTDHGNFEGRNILHLAGRRPGGRGPGRGPSVQEEATLLAQARAKLLRVRESRPRPARDEKILAGWNGLAIAALAEAAAVLGSGTYREAAEQAGGFVLSEMGGRPGGSGLAHSWKDGRISGPGFLDDHASVAEGLLALYACTFDELWFVAARSLVDHLAERFRRPAGGFYDTSQDHEDLIARPRAVFDSPTPTGTSMAATVLLKMAAYTGEGRYLDVAHEALASLAREAGRAPVMSGQWLSAALFAETGATEVAIVGDLSQPQSAALLKAARETFRPHMVLAARPAGAPSTIPILGDREPQPGDSATAWVCRRSTCAPPTGDPAELLRLLERRS
jgi:hypothetical protein